MTQLMPNNQAKVVKKLWNRYQKTGNRHPKKLNKK